VLVGARIREPWRDGPELRETNCDPLVGTEATRGHIYPCAIRPPKVQLGQREGATAHLYNRRIGIPGCKESGHNEIMDTSTVVAVDVSLRLQMRGLWDACRRAAAIAADSIRTRQGLAPLVVGFNDYARWIDVSDLADLECDAVYGTNVQHALSMARYALDGGRGAERILFVAETEPSSYCDVDGEACFYSPPTHEVKRITLNEARACAIAGIRVEFSPSDHRFSIQATRR
jgi:uncharacterized protein with von Willebrand factor type A (vWA) domain